MNIKTYTTNLVLLLTIFPCFLSAQNYSDQLYVSRIDSIYQNIETNVGMTLSPDGKSIVLQDGINDGYIILKPQYSQSPFNEGLPSWNGSAADANNGFRVQMRFPYNGSWSPWLTVGYWKNNIYGTYSKPIYGGGYIDYDNVKLNDYQNEWQFKVIMRRTSSSQPSPSIYKLSFFVSDDMTTDSVNITSIVNDSPAAIFIPTTFIYQYGVDPGIGGDICSPTSVAMILKSYNIDVDPRQFAIDNYDTNFGMFGIWPRVVQNAAEYGLDGAVTRYRTWSEAREVLANGGRISMSVGPPLYTGHLMMLAGFTTDGRPIVHDPAKSNGYSYIFNKTSLSQSWFNKGGIAYTFYFPDSVTVPVENPNQAMVADDYQLLQNYPNPFNPNTNISFSIPQAGLTKLTVYDILGNEIAVLIDDFLNSGYYTTSFNASDLSSGVYIYRIQTENFVKVKQMILLK
ncbi:MAG: C39 family peptidase [Ignavibacteriales bacterium]|nr:C39 family peptidase [Ignavibacteriales bacterium]